MHFRRKFVFENKKIQNLFLNEEKVEDLIRRYYSDIYLSLIHISTLTYIQENYKEKIYIRDLAGLIGMNEQYFCRFFKKVIGRSPMEYVNEYRIKRAIHYLKESDLTVTEICLECGYNNLGNFLREFRKYTSTTPLQYRRHSLKETQ